MDPCKSITLQIIPKPPFAQNYIMKGGTMMMRESRHLRVTDTPILGCIRMLPYKPLKEIPSTKISIVEARLKKWEMCNEKYTLIRYIKLHYKILDVKLSKKIKHTPLIEIREMYSKLEYLWNVPPKLLPLLGPISSEIEEKTSFHASTCINNIDDQNISNVENMIRYIKIIYPNINTEHLDRLSVHELTDFFNSFDIYYNLPGISIHDGYESKINYELNYFKLESKRNFSITKKIESANYIEVSYFSKTLAQNPTSYNSKYTMWYPLSGTGLFFPVENPIIATNKIHAMKLLGCSDEIILKHSCTWFQYLVQKYSKQAWDKMKTLTPTLRSKNIILKTRVFTKIPAQRPVVQGCYEEYDISTIEIKYIKEILDKIINNIIKGKVLKYEQINGNPILIKYDVLLDSGINLLVNMAKKKNITSVLLLNEITASTQGNKLITSREIIHTKKPSESQLQIARLNPLNPKSKSYGNKVSPTFPFPYETKKYIISNSTDMIKFISVQ